MTDEGNDDGKNHSSDAFLPSRRIMFAHHSFTLFTQKKKKREKIENSSNFTFSRVASLKPLSSFFKK